MKKPKMKFQFTMSKLGLLFLGAWVFFVSGRQGLIVFVGAMLVIAALEME